MQKRFNLYTLDMKYVRDLSKVRRCCDFKKLEAVLARRGSAGACER